MGEGDADVNRTKIPWCDWTWNPIVGCSAESAGCFNCYAEAISKRFHLPWGAAHFMPDRLDQPAKVRTPGRVFVCSMSDIGHETVKPDWRDAIRAYMSAAPWHTYIVLTKRPGLWLRQLPTTCWVGVTVESQHYITRWNTLYATAWPGAIKFVSVEPMLGPVSFQAWPYECRPDWVIAGPETGPRARRCDDAWIDALAAKSTCFFDKRGKWAQREWPLEDARNDDPVCADCGADTDQYGRCKRGCGEDAR
jgi:protein gp37